MKKFTTILTFSMVVIMATALMAAEKEHQGRAYIEKNGYQGPETCEKCHPDTAAKFLDTVHWKHASKVTNVENIDHNKEYGMQNRIYTFCNGNEIVNNLKETAKNAAGKSKFTGCNTCHPGDHINKADSTGPKAAAAIDCLVCHSSEYDFRQRKPGYNDKGQVVMHQDRSTKAAMAVGKPSVKNCMVCHESAGGGVLIKRGFAFSAATDVHAAKGMVCVDCHKSKDHKIPTGFDPNNWANDGVRVACGDCHGTKPHKDEDYNRHTDRIACQTCHIIKAGGGFAKDFTKWEKGGDGFYEPTTLRKEVNELTPVYAWYNQTVQNMPHLIGPKGSRTDKNAKIYPFKFYMGKAYYDEYTGNLLSMDFAPPMVNGDALAGVASAAKTLGIEKYKPVAGWQTIYFANSHLVTKKKALSCENCHAANGILRFRDLGYSDFEVLKLTNPGLFFEKLSEKQKEDW